MKQKKEKRKIEKASFTKSESEFLDELKKESGFSKADIIRKAVRLFKLATNRKYLII